MMTSCWDDIMIIWYHIQGTFLCIPYSWATCDDHKKNDIMMRWHDDTHCKVVAIPTGSQRVPLPVESSRCEIGNDYVNDWHAQTVLWLLIKMIMNMIKHIGNNLKVVFTHTWPCWGNPVTQDWHCQPEKGNGQHLIQDHLIFDLKCIWLNTI